MTNVMHGWGRSVVDIDSNGDAYLVVKIVGETIMTEVMRGTGRVMMDFDPSTGMAYPLVKIAGGGSTYASRSSLTLQDDFISGINTTGQGGALGWAQAGTVTGIASEANRPGLVRIDTGAVSGTQARISIAQMQATSAAFDPATLSEQRWMVRLNTNDTDTTVRLGLANSVAGTPGNDGIFFEKGAADTIWQCITRASSSQTKTASAITIDTNFHSFGIRRTSAGVLFYIDYVLVATHTATIPTVFFAPVAQIINSAAASKTMDIDYFELQITGLTR